MPDILTDSCAIDLRTKHATLRSMSPSVLSSLFRLLSAATLLALVMLRPAEAAAHGSGVDLLALLHIDEHHGAHAGAVDPHGHDDEHAPAAEPVAADDHCGCPDCSAVECGSPDDPSGSACSDCPTCDNHSGHAPHPHAVPATLLTLYSAVAQDTVTTAPPSWRVEGEQRPPFIPPRS